MSFSCSYTPIFEKSTPPTANGFAVFQPPRVKSGKSTGREFARTDWDVSSTIELQVARS